MHHAAVCTTVPLSAALHAAYILRRNDAVVVFSGTYPGTHLHQLNHDLSGHFSTDSSNGLLLGHQVLAGNGLFHLTKGIPAAAAVGACDNFQQCRHLRMAACTHTYICMYRTLYM